MKRTKIKKLKKIAKKTSKSTKDRVEILLEDVNSNFKVFGEDLALTRENIRGEIKDFKKEVDYKFETVFDGMGEIHEEIKEVKEDMNERFDEVDYKFEGVFDELRLIRNDLKQKVDRDEFLVLEKRVVFLEKKLVY